MLAEHRRPAICSSRAGYTASGRLAPRDDDIAPRRRPAADAAPAGGLRRLSPEPIARRLRRPRRDSDLDDHVGAFAVGIHGADELADRATRPTDDDYRAITVKALADRLAEAFAEWLHERARHDGTTRPSAWSGEDLVRERFRGIRPAFGYPACPDHSEKRTLFALLDAARAGLALNGVVRDDSLPPPFPESFIGHPGARYFSIGRVGRDQVSATTPRART